MAPAVAAPSSDRVVWLVEGSDATLVSEAVTRLVDELVGHADRSLAVEDFRGDDLDLAVVADACQTPPFLSERRVVVVWDIGRWKTEELRPLLAYLGDPLPTTALVLAAGAGGTIAPKLAAMVKAKGHVISTTVSSRDSAAWVHQRLREASIRLDPDAERFVTDHLGEDVSRLMALIDVLTSAHGANARLTQEDVEPYIGAAGSVTPWSFTDAIDAGNYELAFDQLHRMLEGGEKHPLVVLAILHRHVQSILRVSGPDIATEAQAAAALGIASGRSTYPAKKALASARRLGPAGVADAICLVADTDLALKGAQDWPGHLVLEVLVARLCFLSRTAGGGGRRRNSADARGRRPAGSARR